MSAILDDSFSAWMSGKNVKYISNEPSMSKQQIVKYPKRVHPKTYQAKTDKGHQVLSIQEAIISVKMLGICKYSQ